MKRISLYVAGIVVALVPAILGLTGNASFSQSVPVHVPDRHGNSQVTDDAATPTPTPRSTPTRAADDRGRRADDGPNHDVGDDRGGDRNRGDDVTDNSGPGSTHSGDDHSGRGRGGADDGPRHDVGDDHGTHSGSTSSSGSTSHSGTDDSGHHTGSDDSSHHGGSDDGGHGGHGSDD
jgi:hypothetical protein